MLRDYTIYTHNFIIVVVVVGAPCMYFGILVRCPLLLFMTNPLEMITAHTCFNVLKLRAYNGNTSSAENIQNLKTIQNITNNLIRSEC